MFNIKKISIVIGVIVLAFIGYSYMISGSKQGSSTGVTKQSVSSSQTGSPTGSTQLDGPGKEFVTQLLAIQNIKFNLTLFKDPVFMGLQDYSRELIPQESGRPNPFAPLDGDTGGGASIGSFSGFNSEDIAPASSTPKTTPTSKPIKK